MNQPHPAPEPLRALPHPLGLLLHGRRGDDRQAAARCDRYHTIRTLEFGEGSQINVAIALLIWLMVYPMMLKIDFTSILGVRKKPKGVHVTLFVNWLVKPFSMAFLAWLVFKHVFSGLISPALADQYIAGAIILAAAPCTAMVFVWSYLTDGDPAFAFSCATPTKTTPPVIPQLGRHVVFTLPVSELHHRDLLIIHGLPGAGAETHGINLRYLSEILKRGLMTYRLYYRRLTPATGVSLRSESRPRDLEYERCFSDVVSQFVMPMQSRVYPRNTVVHGDWEVVVTRGRTLARTIGTCSIKVELEGATPGWSEGLSVRVVDNIGYRHISGIVT